MARRTLASDISVSGVALHSGAVVAMTLSPAPPGHGLIFRRSDQHGAEILARYDRVTETRLGTVIADGEASVGVIEHLMAALSGAEIDDLLITLDGPEPPILDGDALCYLKLVEQAGVRERPATRNGIKVLKRVEVVQGEAQAALVPAAERRFDFEIVFATPVIGRQTYSFGMTRKGFASEIAPARTFGFMNELEALNKMNLARGASLTNTLALEGDRIVNADLLRFPDEFVRHKILDAIGDMALAGSPLIARFEGYKSGHGLNNALLRSLFSDPGNYDIVPLP